MSQSRLFSTHHTSHGLQIAHVKAWRRHIVAEVKQLWNDGHPLADICQQLHVSESAADHMLRGETGADVGPRVKPRRAYGSFQRRQLRDLMEVPS